MRVNEARHHDLASEINVAVIERIQPLIRLPRVHLGDTATLTIHLDRDILDELFLFRVEQHGRVHRHNLAGHSCVWQWRDFWP